MQNLFGGIYNGKRVLVTGHTGFKGSWLVYWLSLMGAEVIGYSLKPPTEPNHISLLTLDIISIEGDIRDLQKLQEVFTTYKPDIVFHLAAQALVMDSYINPIETYETNVMGTLKVFESCRQANVEAIVNITSDKAYENKEWIWGYRENDPMGGYDPYSSSKGCAELLSASYRNSYFKENKDHNTLLATCRAGNVIGGGDWAKNRLIVDIVKAASKGEKVEIRSPDSTRPWQHVLEPLSGYLMLGWRLLEGKEKFAEGWNIGPNDQESLSVEEAVGIAKSYWDKIVYTLADRSPKLHEAKLLRLDCSKAKIVLGWSSVWSSREAFEKTIKWYKNYYECGEFSTASDLESYVNAARSKKTEWTQ